MTSENPILIHLERGTLLRNAWGDGQKTACLYSALVPGAKGTDNCPADIMPQWLANVTPGLDDNISNAGWSNRMRRYGVLSSQWHVISPERWEYIRRQWSADCIERAVEIAARLEHGDYWSGVQAACAAIIADLRRNENLSQENINAACDKATLAADTAWKVWAAEKVVKAAAWAAWAAADTAGAAWAGQDAEAVTEATATAVEKVARALDSPDAAKEEAWDWMFDRLMERIEAETRRARSSYTPGSPQAADYCGDESDYNDEATRKADME